MSRRFNLGFVVFAMALLAVGLTSALAHAGHSPASFVPTPNPTFDVTGRWKSNAGDEMQVFQEKDEVNAILVNSGWAHRLEGRYVNPTTIRFVLIRRTRSGGCEVTMDLDLKVNSSSSLTGAAVASETGCGINQGQSYPSTWTRVL